MPMYNLIEHIKYYRKTTGRLWKFYGDEPNNSLPLIIMQIPQQILNHLNIKQVLQEKHQMQIKKTVKTLSKKIQRLRKILKLLSP